MLGLAALPRNGFVSPVVTLRVQFPSFPFQNTTPESVELSYNVVEADPVNTGADPKAIVAVLPAPSSNINVGTADTDTASPPVATATANCLMSFFIDFPFIKFVSFARTQKPFTTRSQLSEHRAKEIWRANDECIKEVFSMACGGQA
jgi:hypothetical protein